MGVRIKKIESVIKRDISDILLKDYQHHALITVTGVRITEDLSLARIHISVLDGGTSGKAIFESIQEQSVEIRLKLAQRIRHQVRKIPEIQFYLDDTAEYVNKIEKIFGEIKNQSDS